MYYAHLTPDGICRAVTQGGRLTVANVVEIARYDTSLLGKRYVSGEWQEVAKNPTAPRETQLDRIEAMLSAIKSTLEKTGVTP
jgi:hypothetical protein